MIKYIGSKRRLVPILGELLDRTGASSALDLFTGTTRVAQEFKRRGALVTAVDNARYAATFARCYVECDEREIDHARLAAEIERLNHLPGVDGYVTETFCCRARYFHPDNGRRIDAIRAAIAAEFAGSPLEPILLTSLVEAADRVDSTVGVQMAYLKQWAPRARQPLSLRVPHLLGGRGRAVWGDALVVLPGLGHHDLAYLDPPYNQHRYVANYHVWETLVAGDEPDHYGVACKRADLRDPASTSVFNKRAEMPAALARVIETVDADIVVVSYNDEAWVSLEALVEMCRRRGRVRVHSFDSRRYVGALIGVHNRRGERVGTPERLHNIEYVVVAHAA